MAAVVAGTMEMGYSWDEALAHFQGSEIIRDWLSQAQEKILAGQWGALWEPSFHRKYWPVIDPELHNLFNVNYHPPLTRILPTITWFFFHGWLGDFVAYRMAPAILFSLSVMVLFRVMAREFDYATGLFSALSLVDAACVRPRPHCRHRYRHDGLLAVCRRRLLQRLGR